MGYSYYWKQKQAVPPATWQAICEDFRKLRTIALIDEQLPPIQLEYDQSEPVEITSENIRFNGVGDDGHETLVVKRDSLNFDFCKTNGKPYDIWVTALLILMHFHAPDVWGISSDGGAQDWVAGLNLVRLIHPTASSPIN